MSNVLTAQREAFCQHYIEHRNGAAAYRAAFNVDPRTKDRNVVMRAAALIGEQSVLDRLVELQKAGDREDAVCFTVNQALGRWLEIAAADPDELIGLRVGCCRYCWGEGFGYQWKEREYLEALAQVDRQVRADEKGAAKGLYPLPDPAGGFGFRKAKLPHPDCPECEGEGVERVVARDTSKLSPAAKALYGGVKQTKDGPQMIIADRMKALENATRMVGGFQDRVRVDGSIAAMIAVVKELPKDPAEASRAYMQLIASNAA